MEDIKETINNKFNSADIGREIYLNTLEANSISTNDYLILMPSLDFESNYYVVLYLEQFLMRKSTCRVFLVTSQLVIKKLVDSIYGDKYINNIIIVNMPDKEMFHIIDLYSLYKFTDKLIIASLEYPVGRTIGNLVNKKGITKEELVSIAVLENRSFEKVDYKYDGDDEELLNLFKNIKDGE